jgi:hypothetical protein
MKRVVQAELRQIDGSPIMTGNFAGSIDLGGGPVATAGGSRTATHVASFGPTGGPLVTAGGYDAFVAGLVR